MTRFASADGTRYEVWTGGAGPAVLLLHGFAGRSGEWAPFLPALRRTRTTVTVDLLGHGASDAPEDSSRHGVERQAADLTVMLDRLGLAPADVVGYSFGARVALRLAVDSPELVRSLFLESPSAGIADGPAREARRASDDTLAELLERDGIGAFVARWEAQPLFASEATLPLATRARLRRMRLRNDPRGLAASLRGAGQGAMTPLCDRLRAICVPTLVLAGGFDPVGVGRATDVARAIPGACLTILDGVGHAPHREDPHGYRTLLLEHLADASTTPSMQHRRSS